MNIAEYGLKIEEIEKLPNNDFECSICMNYESKDKLIKTNCNHVYHMSCMKQHITTKIYNNTNKIQCPLDSCKAKISSKTIYKLFEDDQDVLFKFKKNKISNDYKYCICCKCQLYYCEKNNDKFIDYCEGCKSVHCFQCGNFHSELSNCFEANETLKREIDECYKNTNYILKMCPHCYLPHEKMDGCELMKCGYNYDDDINTKTIMKLYGCGKKFNWNDAKQYTQIRNTISNVETYNIKIHNVISNFMDNTYFYGINIKVILFIGYIILIFIFME